jgi:hypothetical protein
MNYFKNWKRVVLKMKKAQKIMKILKQIVKNVYMHKTFLNKIKYFHIWAIKAEKITISL